VPVPPSVVTAITPVDAPEGTLAVIVVSFTTLKKEAAPPPKATDVAAVKCEPLTVTTVPTGPVEGEKPVIAGPGMYVNAVALVAVPPGVATETSPVVSASDGTTAVIDESLTTTNEAAMPLNLTEAVPVRCEPEIVTVAPPPAEAGENPVIAGGSI
jgi:hypothetical protein